MCTAMGLAGDLLGKGKMPTMGLIPWALNRKKKDAGGGAAGAVKLAVGAVSPVAGAVLK